MRLEHVVASDERWSQRLADWGKNRTVRTAAWLLARSGDSLTWLILIGVLFWRQSSLAWPLLITVAAAALATAILKLLFRRRRPVESLLTLPADKYAFPSGHSARASALATGLAFAMPDYLFLFFLWAGAVALARVVLSRHYLFDVIGGMVLGVVVGLLMQLV